MEITEPVQVYLLGRWRPWRQKHQRFRFDGMNVRARRVLRKVRRRNNKESMKYEGHIDKNNALIKNEKINVNEMTKKRTKWKKCGKEETITVQ